MGQDIIQKNSISFQAIKEDLDTYLRGLSNWEEIKDSLPASNLTLIEELIAGFASYLLYKQQILRKETYLQTAQLHISVYNIAKTFGYIVNRFKAPVIQLKYFGNKTLTLTSGTILGSYQDYDIVFFGNNDIIEKGDYFYAYIGKFNELQFTINTVTGEVIQDLLPEFLEAVDNEAIEIFINDIQQPITKAVEDYVVFGKIADYSLNPFSTRLFISDMNNNYGVPVQNKDSVKIKFIETDGLMDTIKTSDIQLNENYTFIDIQSYGANGDDLDKIRKLAPLLYSTLRRAVTEADYEYISKMFPLFKDVKVERDLGQPLKVKLTPEAFEVGKTYSIEISAAVYTYATQDGDDLNTVLAYFLENIGRNYFVSIIEENQELIIESLDSRNYNLTIKAVSGFTLEELQDNVMPESCTINLYYIKNNVVDEPIELTAFERKNFSDFIVNYKMVGTKILLIPAKVEYLEFKLKIGLINPIYFEDIKAQIKEILSKYEIKLNQGFKYGEVLSAISQITIIENDTYISPITSIIPMQDIYNKEAKKDLYYKFSNIEIILAE